MSSGKPFEKICDNVFALSSNIRLVGIINGMGDIVAGGMREGIQSLEDEREFFKIISRIRPQK